MEQLDHIIGLISGDAGTIVVLAFIIWLLMKGNLHPKSYLDELQETKKTLLQSMQDQAESMQVLAETSAESLETSRTALKILTEAAKGQGRY